MINKNEHLNEKAAWYYAWGNFLSVLSTLFGIVPAVMGFMSNNSELCYQGLNFFIVSFALIMALRSGYFLSDRTLKRGWKHWLEINEDKIKKTDKITVLLMVLVFIFLIARDFYGVNKGFISIANSVLSGIFA
ncbi:hypothetical protein [Psychrobacter sp. TWR1-1-1]|uniref:hypothetical protein n=1 Tax=Psychrobacter sp. TWR1-1-1 TaxID=2804665 RepID=UPI003CF1389A